MTVSYKKLGKGTGGGDYYINAAQLDDYYLNEGVSDDPAMQREPPGRWYDPTGTMPAIRDGEAVDAATFRSLLGGFDPGTGKALLKGGAGDQHVSGYDFTFSVPKGISAIWSQLDADQRGLVEKAQSAAVHRALQFMSDKAWIARGGAGGSVKENVHLMAALWDHASSRENDPQLHTHATIFNLAKCANGSYRAVDVNQTLKWQTAIAGIYHTELAAQLTDTLGIACEVRDDEFIFHVKGVPEPVTEFWSKRGNAIKAAAAERSVDALSKAVLDKITIETRDKKSELTRAQLLERWVQEGQTLGFTREHAEALFHQANRDELSPADIKDIAEKAITRLTYTHSVFNESAAYAMVGVLMQGRGTAADIEKAGEWLVKERLVQMGISPDGHRVFSTPEMIALEKQMIEDAKIEAPAHIQPADAVAVAILAKKGISDEQADAVRHACLDSRMVSVVEGSAGAGKSFTMEAVKSVYEGQGYTLHGLALSWTAAGVLSDEAKIEHTRAIEGFVRDVANGKVQLDAKSVVIVDEAGLVGSRHMSAILTAAKEAGAKVILTGDSKQLAPVEAGGAVEAIIEEIGSARIDEVRRQGAHVRNDPEKYAAYQWQRDAVLQFADGHADMAMQAYDDHGLVTLADDNITTLDVMVADWNAYRLSAGDSTSLLLANDNQTVREINARVRNLLRGEGRIGEDAVSIRTTDLKKTSDTAFAVGDRIMFRKNDKELGIQGDPTKKQAASGVYNRTTGTIREIRQDKDGAPLFTIELQKGGTVEIRAGKGGYWDGHTKAVPLQHAYATTIYGSQGMTVDRSFLLDSRHIERRLAYVGMSRHRDECRVYVDRQAVHERLMERLGADEWRPIAEVTDAELMESVKKSWSRASEKLTTVQYLKEQAGQRPKKEVETQARQDKTLSILKTNTNRMEATMHTLSKSGQMSADQRRAKAEQEYKEFGERIETAKRIDLPAWLTSRGVQLKKEGTKGFVEKDPTGDKPFHFFCGDDGKWRARAGETYLDAVGYIQQLERMDFKDTVNMVTGYNDPAMTQSAIQAQRLAQRSGANRNQVVRAIVIRAATDDQRKRAADYARDERGISRETLKDAHQKRFISVDDRGVTFIGHDAEGKIRNAETRLLKPEKWRDDWLSKISYPESDKTFSPILRGNDRDVHMVEGGFDALALHDMHKRESKEPPTVIVTGGARTLKWSQNPQVQDLLKNATTITNHHENEVDKKTGLPDPKKQAETDAGHEKQAAAIVEIRGSAEGIKNARPPAGMKDLADWNKKQQEHHQRQLQLHEEEHRSSMRP